MFITSFEEQNITYRSCSNLRIHLSLRALLLKAYGYETKVFEFVALEHTSKNKMILATKRKALQQPDPKIMQQIQALKAMYGIEKQSLELLLQDQMPVENIGCKC